jgi:hypothetical protein
MVDANVLVFRVWLLQLIVNYKMCSVLNVSGGNLNYENMHVI